MLLEKSINLEFLAQQLSLFSERIHNTPPPPTAWKHLKEKQKHKRTKTIRESNSTSNADTFAIKRSFEVEDLSPPESSPISQNHRGPGLYQVEPLAQQAAAAAKEMEVYRSSSGSGVGVSTKTTSKMSLAAISASSKIFCNS